MLPWSHDRTTLVDTKAGQETFGPITWVSRDVAGMSKASKTFPWNPHVIQQAFRRGPEEHQGAVASSLGAC